MTVIIEPTIESEDWLITQRGDDDDFRELVPPPEEEGDES